MPTTDAKPKFTFSSLVLGSQIQAAVWENEREYGDESFIRLSVTISRRYYDEHEKQWKTAKGFRDSDLLTSASAAQELYRQLAEENLESQPSSIRIGFFRSRSESNPICKNRDSFNIL
jgi:hypothetical protein